MTWIPASSRNRAGESRRRGRSGSCRQALPPDTIFTADSGSNAFFAIHYLKMDKPDAFAILFGLASMGSGLPAAIGAQVGHPRRTVVSVCGDAGFHMASAELTTAAQYGMPLVVLVLNDERHGMVEKGNMAVYGRTPSYPTSPLRIPDLARASGADCSGCGRAQSDPDRRAEARPAGPSVGHRCAHRSSTKVPATSRLNTIKAALAPKALN